MFAAKAAFTAALARCEADTWQLRELVPGGPSALQPYLNSVIGQQQFSKSHEVTTVCTALLYHLCNLSHLCICHVEGLWLDMSLTWHVSGKGVHTA